ncbi:MAG TPA: GMC family oxidoreductase [Gemmatimonadales bacterium]|nr:GMC family oxidoreductase [Gemmatimonadales bacterium]
MRLDATTLRDHGALEADLCIVGGGPAGLALAHELAARGLACTLLESGGIPSISESQDLNAGTSAVDPYPDLRVSRCRAVGGTAAIWNTYLGGEAFAKYVPLDPIDFEHREALPGSGWPFGFADLEPYYRAAQAVCGLGPFDYRAMAWATEEARPLALTAGGITQSVYQLGAAARFTSALPGALERLPGVTLVEGATVTGFELQGERISALRWATLSGRSGTVRAGRVVLAAGAIENARLLLILGREAPFGLDPGDWLGRGFMEHPVDQSLRLVTRDPAAMSPAGFFGPRPTEFGAVTGRLGLSPDVLRAEGLLNASIRLLHDIDPAALRLPGLRSVARRLVPLRGLRRLLGNLARRGYRATTSLRKAGVRVQLDLEQAAHRDNRVVLSGRLDAVGLPRPELRWHWHAEDEERRRRVRTAFIREIEESGVGRLVPSEPEPLETAVHHHAGTTRMSLDPRHGVVDPAGRVHQLENLFVTGASVFPSAGVANPTLTAVALSLRLADYLDRGRRSPPPAGRTPGQS